MLNPANTIDTTAGNNEYIFLLATRVLASNTSAHQKNVEVKAYMSRILTQGTIGIHALTDKYAEIYFNFVTNIQNGTLIEEHAGIAVELALSLSGSFKKVFLPACTHL